MTPAPSEDQIPAYLDEVGPGWRALLLRLHQQLLPIVPGYTVAQVKEKFGGLRVYLDDGMPMAVHELIDAAESESLRVCEYCGKPGGPRPGGWVKTLCEDCAVKR